MSKPALIFFFTARVHTTKSTVKMLAANTHCKYFFFKLCFVVTAAVWNFDGVLVAGARSF
jgi:hypothetical protein